MREDSLNWWKQALSDREKADVLFDSGHFDGAAFFYQQAVEKALKALSIESRRESPRGHSIIRLAEMTGVPIEMMSGIRDLNPEYLITRYPDAAAGVPAEMYDAQIVDRHRQTASEVLTWVKESISR